LCKRSLAENIDTVDNKQRRMATIDNNWRNWFADTIYRRGVQYYKNGHVIEMHKITGGCEAIVAWHYLYRVEIITENDRVKDTHCNCQYAYRGEKCKHQVAALLKYKYFFVEKNR